MTSAYLPLTFCLDPDSAIDTLEAVLAIARRGGLQLSSLNLHARQTDQQVSLELLGADADMLDLFERRLGNLFGVFNIERHAIPARRQASSVSTSFTPQTMTCQSGR